MYAKLLQNHVLSNLTFGLILVLGAIAYTQLPREQDPSVNFNWLGVRTLWPGASAEDVERRVTDPLEEGVERIDDTKFVTSSSRQGISTILMRFEDIDSETYNLRLNDLRREIQNQLRELPSEVRVPEIIEVSSANLFPTATLAVSGIADDERLRQSAVNIRKDLERVSGIDRVETIGQTGPELHVHFSPEYLIGLGVSPIDLAETVQAYFRDLAAGSIDFGDQRWLVRLVGTDVDPRYLEALPILTNAGEIPLRSVATVVRGRNDPEELVRFKGQPAVMLSVFKDEHANNVELLDRIRTHIAEQNPVLSSLGIKIVLLEDQSLTIRHAIEVMQNNALIGLGLVLMTVWAFLGFRVALLTSISIPFVLAGVFILLVAFGQTLNSTTLLGVVIVLGMLVDDAIVVVEAIYSKIREGYQGVAAALAGLQEVSLPVASAVLTTIAAFLPLMLMPGVLGDYMKHVPAIVSIALLISLIEAFWMLPSHMIEARIDQSRPSRAQEIRDSAISWIRSHYTRWLLAFLNLRRLIFLFGALLLAVAIGIIAGGLVKVDYFATDLYRLFYINVDMPPGTTVEKTLTTVEQIELEVREHLEPDEARAVISFAGQRFSETEQVFGQEHGQVFVSLNPAGEKARGVDEIIDSVRAAVKAIPGPSETSFLRRKLGPPTLKPISVKVRGNDIMELRIVGKEIKAFLSKLPGIKDISDDDVQGSMELKARLKPDAIVRAGLNPVDVVRALRLYADGEIVATMQHEGERLDVRVRTQPKSLLTTQSFLDYPIGLPDGKEVALGNLIEYEVQPTIGNIRHYEFRRAITVEADIDPAVTDALTANEAIKQFWVQNNSRFPGIDIDITGQFDDIQESLSAILALFIGAIGLIYLILGAHFKSYLQPLIILSAVPMAFIGVTIGLFVSGNPLSLYTLYGIVALAGIAANDSIVLISAANQARSRGLGMARAIVIAAKRRILPILITSVTTIAGLLSLAFGLAGESLMWGPVATAIIWGLAFSTVLTLFFVPALYLVLTGRRGRALMPSRARRVLL